MGDIRRIEPTVAQQRKWMQESIIASITPEDIADIIKVLHKKALDGSIAAAAIVLDRVAGKPVQEVVIDEVAREATPDELRRQFEAILDKRPDLAHMFGRVKEARKVNDIKVLDAEQTEPDETNPDESDSHSTNPDPSDPLD